MGSLLNRLNCPFTLSRMSAGIQKSGYHPCPIVVSLALRVVFLKQ